MKVVFLDAGPLGMASNPRSSPENERCKKWVADQVSAGATICVPEIADYEVRRELLRAGKLLGLQRLDALLAALQFVAITTEAMQLAAQLWAQARQRGQPTAPPEALDGDAILAAQALTAGFPPDELVIAISNIGHLAQFVAAEHWASISTHADADVE
jgi:predicted nucleic acid-binding protein